MIDCLVKYFFLIENIYFLFLNKHFFCEDCINTWLIKKKNNCPICRYDINIKDYQKKINNKGQWTIVDFDNNDYMIESQKIMEDAIEDILSS